MTNDEINPKEEKRKTALGKAMSETEVLILHDGRILVHNLTLAFAELLVILNPADTQIQPRAYPLIHHVSPITSPAP
jgi:hypothetical protein